MRPDHADEFTENRRGRVERRIDDVEMIAARHLDILRRDAFSRPRIGEVFRLLAERNRLIGTNGRHEAQPLARCRPQDRAGGFRGSPLAEVGFPTF